MHSTLDNGLHFANRRDRATAREARGMTQNQHTEFGTGRGVERKPDGKPRPLTDRERARIERTAAIRDASLADTEREARRAQ